jgi:7-cyano-7-deazaguanine reductase
MPQHLACFTLKTIGTSIDVFFAQGEIPQGVWVPDQGVAPYRGRG